MSITIINYGASLRITTDGTAFLIFKSQIRSIETLRDDTLRIDIGGGALGDVLIKLSDVIQPAGIPDVAALRDAVNSMCNTFNSYEEQTLQFMQTQIGEQIAIHQVMQLFQTSMQSVLSSQQLLLNAVLTIDGRLSSPSGGDTEKQMVDLVTAISETGSEISGKISGVLSNQMAHYNHIEQLRVNISDCYNQLQSIVGQITNLSLVISSK